VAAAMAKTTHPSSTFHNLKFFIKNVIVQCAKRVQNGSKWLKIAHFRQFGYKGTIFL
jgi:hypothetical protein